MGADGSEMETMAIITTAGNATMAAIHDRMPVILPPERYDGWLDVRGTTAPEAVHWLRPAPDDLLEAFAVSKALSNSRNEGPAVQTPAAGEQKRLV
jgi:putative SOS response-associated peptidase YedK